MDRKTRYGRWMAAIAVLVGCACAACAAGMENSGDRDYYQDLQDRRRADFLPAATVVSELRITPGMKILDLGAGKGYFTFSLADALNGTGQVVATDVAPLYIDFLRAQVKERGYTNIVPVLVKGNDDPFYRSQRFDLILISEVCCFFRDRAAEFGALRGCLRPGGRIVVIDVAVRAGFYSGSFDDMGRLCREIRQEGPGFPLYARLGEKLRRYIGTGDLSRPLPREYRDLLVRELNAVLEDRTFFDAIDRYFSGKFGEPGLSRAGRSHIVNDGDAGWYVIRWLAYQLKEAGALSKSSEDMSAYERNSLALLNELIIRRMFKDSFNAHYYLATANMAVPREIVRQMKEAGLVLLRSHSTLPFHFFLEFSPAPSRRGFFSRLKEVRR